MNTFLLGKLAAPPPANDRANYHKKNRGLESVAMHPDYAVITTPEAPLQGRPAGFQTVHANGHAWVFLPGSRRTAVSKGVEVPPDGNLLVLERSRPGLSKGAWVASLHRVDITRCDAPVTCNAALLAALPAEPGNFEGLTLLDARHALIASKNGGDSATSRTPFRVDRSAMNPESQYTVHATTRFHFSQRVLAGRNSRKPSARSTILLGLQNIEAQTAEIGCWSTLFKNRPTLLARNRLLEKVREQHDAVSDLHRLAPGPAAREREGLCWIFSVGVQPVSKNCWRANSASVCMPSNSTGRRTPSTTSSIRKSMPC